MKELYMISPDRILGVDLFFTSSARDHYILPDGITFDDVSHVGVKYDEMWITLKDGTIIEAPAPDSSDILQTIDFRRPEVEFDNQDINIHDLSDLPSHNILTLPAKDLDDFMEEK